MGAATCTTYFRIAGNAVFFIAHIVNVIVMFILLHSDIMEDENLQRFHSMQWQYITVWNMAFQLVHLACVLVLDLHTVVDIPGKKLIPALRKHHVAFVDSLLWPVTLVIFTIYWPIYLYDRELIYPLFIDKVVPQASNHMMHSIIVPVLLWDFLFRSRVTPKSHTKNLTRLTLLYVAYTIVLLENYFRIGTWPYPMLEHIYGTLFFPLLLFFVGILLLFFYKLQWTLLPLIHGVQKTNKIK